MSDRLLPQGSRLLHIGPAKTGTTSLQRALSRARLELPQHGVTYPGGVSQHWKAALALRPDAVGMRGATAPAYKEWEALVLEVRRTPQAVRVVISSEFFAGVDEATAALVVSELGGPRVHVLVTLRPPAALLSSAWQQFVRRGRQVGYERWLESVLDDRSLEGSRSVFWRRYCYEDLIARWTAVAGRHHLTALVVDETDRAFMPRSVEDMLGLPTGLLDGTGERTNRSLTLDEIELVRRVNKEFARRGWSSEAHRRLVHPLVRGMQERTVRPEEERIRTPAWALDRAAVVGARSAERVAALGVNVIGDLSTLGTVPSRVPAGPVRRPSSVSWPVATAAVIAMMEELGGDEPPQHVRSRAAAWVDHRIDSLSNVLRPHGRDPRQRPWRRSGRHRPGERT